MSVVAIGELADAWWWFVTRSVIDGCIALCFVALLWTLLRKKHSPRIGCILFLAVVAKAFVPFTLPIIPTAIIGTWLPAESAAARPESFTLAIPLMLSWTVIVGFWAIRFAHVQRRCGKTLRGATTLRDPRFVETVNRLRKKAGVAESVRVLVSHRAESPMVVGLIRPTVILPAKLLDRLTLHQFAWVVMHEFAHVRRHDLWVSLFQRVAQIVQFYNPAVWVANWMIDQLREFACDDFALASTKVSRRDGGEGFLAVVELANGRPTTSALAMGMANEATRIRSRLIRLLDDKPIQLIGGMRVSGVLTLCVFLVSLPALRASLAVDRATSGVVPTATTVQFLRDVRPSISTLEFNFLDKNGFRGNAASRIAELKSQGAVLVLQKPKGKGATAN